MILIMLKWAYNKDHVKIRLSDTGPSKEINKKLCLPETNTTRRRKKVQRSMTTTLDVPQFMTYDSRQRLIRVKVYSKITYFIELEEPGLTFM